MTASLPDEDAILNTINGDEWDNLNDLDILDEDKILGDVGKNYVDFVESNTAKKLPETRKIESIIGTSTYEITAEINNESLDCDEGAKTPVEDEADEESDNNKDEEEPRDKFQSERGANSSSQLTNAPTSRIIPDSLDDVQVKPEVQMTGSRGRGNRGRFGHNKVLINPQYRGSVPQQSNIRLRCDRSQTPLIHFGAITVLPTRPIIPTASNLNLMQQRFGVDPASQHRSGMAPYPLPLFGTPPSHSNRFSSCPAQNLSPHLLPHPPIPFLPPPTILRTNTTLTTASGTGPLLAMPANVPYGKWNRMVDAFVERTNRQRESMTQTVREGSPTSTEKRRRSMLNSSIHSTSLPRNGDRRRKLNEQHNAPLKPKSTKSVKDDEESARAIGVDGVYLKKLEEQNRLRNEMLRRKEQRRIQKMKRGQVEHSMINSTRSEKAPVSSPVQRPVETSNQRQKSRQSTAISNSRRLIMHSSQPLLRTIINSKSGQLSVNSNRRPSSSSMSSSIRKKASVHLSINDRFSSSQFEKKLAKHKESTSTEEDKTTIGVAAVVQNITNWGSGALGRLTLIAGTVGSVKKCWKSALDTVSIIFEDQSQAVTFMNRYNSKVVNGIELSVKLEPVVQANK